MDDRNSDLASAAHRITLAVVGLLAFTALPTHGQNDNSCVKCHQIIDEARYSDPVAEFENDVHGQLGFGCEVCHGGDSAIIGRRAKHPSTGYLGLLDKRQIVEACSGCHSDPEFMRNYNPAARVDQLARYRTSIHGQRLFSDDDPNVATCVDCHTSHSIQSASESTSTTYPPTVAETCAACHADSSYMRDYDVPTDQHEKYKMSVHAQMMEEGDLSAPTCNDCHGNHGAAPPEVEWVGHACGQCHATEEALFNASVHPEHFAETGTPGCAQCHGNHEILPASDEMLSLGSGSACAECHDRDDEGGQASITMLARIDSLRTGFHRVDSLLERAEVAGVDVSSARFELQDATTALVRLRTITHAANLDSVEVQTKAGFEVIDTGEENAFAAFRELRFRRLGLLVSSLIILVLVIGLRLKIRELEAGARFTLIKSSERRKRNV